MKQEFCKGVFVKKVDLTTFSLIKVSVNLKEFQTQVNESGYVNFDIKKSKAGKYYAVLNTWKPKPQNNIKENKPLSSSPPDSSDHTKESYEIDENGQDDFNEPPF